MFVLFLEKKKIKNQINANEKKEDCLDYSSREGFEAVRSGRTGRGRQTGSTIDRICASVYMGAINYGNGAHGL
ncbi:unnamed protein product [Arabis nemorensis]|uniref:Uncharacterized protein n=1 Tax=Arabis nemorensis TaxID=586526 RepID=A0A565AZC3_9BRAS|nr:unnamed protein product [Arabis nemorensis]